MNSILEQCPVCDEYYLANTIHKCENEPKGGFNPQIYIKKELDEREYHGRRF